MRASWSSEAATVEAKTATGQRRRNASGRVSSAPNRYPIHPATTALSSPTVRKNAAAMTASTSHGWRRDHAYSRAVDIGPG